MDWINWIPMVLLFGLAFAWKTWAYGWRTSARTLVLVVAAILVGLVVQRLVFAG